MNIIFLGATQFSYQILSHLINNNFKPKAVFSIPQSFNLKQVKENQSSKYLNSNYANLDELAKTHQIPSYFVTGIENNILSHKNVFDELKPDIILVMGWYYLVPKSIRETAIHGALGLHASMLPSYAGGSPLVWALINGESKTGISLFKLDSGVDCGDLLKQIEIPISDDDTIATLYGKVTEEAKNLILVGLKDICEGRAIWTKQTVKPERIYPIRKEEDGLIEWSKTTKEIYNFIRAQTKPYPCAFSFLYGNKVKFIKAMPYYSTPLLSHRPGSLVQVEKNLLIRTSDGYIYAEEVEILGKTYQLRDYCIKNKLNGAFDDE